MRLLAFCLVFLVSCVGVTSPSHIPVRVMYIHADKDFTPAERDVIAQATRELMSQASILVHVTYDLDFRKGVHSTRLVRVTSRSELVREYDRWFGGVVYGWTRTIPRTELYVAADRLNDAGFALHVFLHEFLHAFGADHVEDEKAVMYGLSDAKHRAVVLTEADRAALRVGLKNLSSNSSL